MGIFVKRRTHDSWIEWIVHFNNAFLFFPHWQSHTMLLGRHATSIHEILPVEDIHYLESPDAGEAPANIGQILVTMSHSVSAGMAITVHEVMNLQPRPFSSSLDPYVRIRVASRETGI